MAEALTSVSMLLLLLIPSAVAMKYSRTSGDRGCRGYCSNITVDYPFSLQDGCGHPGFRQLLFCFNGVLLLHVVSGSYRVLDIDYAYKRLTLSDPTMSDCYALQPGGSSSPGNGFVAGTWRSRFLQLAQDNVFFLLGCRRDSPIFQLGFPDSNSVGICRNVSGMGCEDYYRCPGWDATLAAPAGSKSTARTWARSADSAYGVPSNTPECCSVPGGAIREINLTLLRCAAYSSAYTLAPLRPRGPGTWSYGIRATYLLPSDHELACRACQASGGACGYNSSLPEAEGAVYGSRNPHLCLCGDGLWGIDAWNSTSTCDFPGSSGSFSLEHALILNIVIGGLLFYAGNYLLIFHVFNNDKP